ncbi:MAG: hypothetical protein A2271_02840 [Candidatus Moranbacteria bacterium RIFOXYA12_FULL_35_19]|nr:MAG: hypothetical protein UR78_C0002G0006 [Candidatus Moranbacteria bacterium GW2011_GWF2_35_39]OGI33220.1 MAG: hypothetical protein A2489_04305 [Candidatus Moranbacteria bacterium RIFOXYC12_FULL_36_13]OGI36618.1 MAG: hypothetical protein A2271_02840 [Candidatus Moranbacteria bacterium RIFOXYA12_FULL_35_19]
MKNKRNKILIKMFFLAILFFGFVEISEAKDLFVSTTGNDAVTYANNDINNPWLTVEKAWADAQTNDVVYYRAGTYTITAQINNLTSGASVTHTNYQDEVVTWESSLCDGAESDHGVIHVSEDNITVDGINGNWTGSEDCFADTGFFVMGWSAKAVSADYFTLKDGDWTSAKYGQNGGIVFAALRGTDHSTHVMIENVNIIGAGAEVGSINTSGIMTFQAEDWTIKNCEISNVNTGIFFNKHPSIASAVGGTIENNYIHTVHSALRTQTNNTEFTNNIFNGSVSMGYDSGPCSIDGNVGSDNNTWTHNTFTGYVELSSATRDGDNELVGTVYPVFENNIMPAVNVDIHRYSVAPTYYEGDYNLWPPAGTIYVYEGGSSAKILTTFRTFLGGCPNDDNECNSLEQVPIFAGGASLDEIADFALTAESPGYQACADSSDMGADISLVGIDAGEESDTTPPSAPSGLSVS